MADYDSLDTLIKEAKKSAIDAYMKSQNFIIQGERYFRMEPARPEAIVTKPDSEGLGGGTVIMGDIFPKEAFVSLFDDIRSRIDNAVGSWKGLPKPNDLDEAKEKCQKVYSAVASEVITGGTSSEGESAINGSSASYLFQRADLLLEEMSGSAITAFQDNFLSEAQRILNNQCFLALDIEAGIIAEKEAITGTRQAVADAVEQAQKSFAFIASGSGGGGGVDLVFDVLSSVLKIAKTAMGPDPATAKKLDIGSTLVGSVGSIGDTMRTFHPVGGDYASVMTQFENALKVLGEDFKRLETLVDMNLKLDARTTRDENNRSEFDFKYRALHSRDIDDMDKGPNPPSREVELQIPDTNLALEISDVYLPEAASFIRGAASDVRAINVPINRDGNVGLGPKGPSESFYEFTNLLAKLLVDMAQDIEMGAVNFRQVVQMYEEADGANAELLDKIADALDSITEFTDPMR